MQVIDQINGSALFAQSAYSASNATKDNLGRDITATYLTSHQSLDGYATTAWVNEQGYITEINIPESATWQDVSTTVQSNSAQWAEGGGGGGDPEVNSFVYDNSASINDVNSSYKTYSSTFLTALPSDLATTGDLDSLSTSIAETYYPYSNPSSFVNEDWVTAQGYITGVDLSEYAKRDFVLSSIESATSGKLDVSSFASVSSDFLTTSFGISESAHWEEATNAYEQNSGTYLTAVDLSQYATETLVEETSGAITSLIPTDYYPDTNPSGFISGVDLSPYATTNELEQVSADITATIPSTAGLASESYVQTNSAVLTGMIDAKQDTLTFGYDEQDRINSINSSALAGGGDVPEDVMVETNLEYNAVGEISGYGNSAIAQYGAEKQWLVHDDTLVHAANSAQYALGVNVSAVAQLLGVDETVLFSGDATTANFPLHLNEPLSAFKTIKFYWQAFNYNTFNWTVSEKICRTNDDYYTLFDGIYNNNNGSWFNLGFCFKEDNGNLNYVSGAYNNWTNNTVGNAETFLKMFKIIGIGRKQ